MKEFSKFMRSNVGKRVILQLSYTLLGFFVILTILYWMNYNIKNEFSITYSSLPLVIITATISIVLLGLLLIRYLQPGHIRTRSDRTSFENKLKFEIQEIKFQLLRMMKQGGADEGLRDLSKQINELIDNTLTEDFLREKIEKIYSVQILKRASLKDLYNDLESLGNHIHIELARLSKGANLNLVIGTLATVVAIFALSLEVFRSNIEFSNTIELLSHYIPRLFLVVFIEIFAFFFLKLYKTNLEDIKYFNNEKTNIHFKLLSLKVAINRDDEDALKLIIEELVKTERNFKLSKDESTIGLEKLRVEQSNNKVFENIISRLSEKI